MLRDLVRSVAVETGITQAKAREALGIILNAAERQGSPFADELFSRLPGARTLSARTGSEIGASYRADAGRSARCCTGNDWQSPGVRPRAQGDWHDAAGDFGLRGGHI